MMKGGNRACPKQFCQMPGWIEAIDFRQRVADASKAFALRQFFCK